MFPPPAVTAPAPLCPPRSCPGRVDLHGPWMLGKGRNVTAKMPSGVCVLSCGSLALVSRGLASGSLERSGDVVRNGAPSPQPALTSGSRERVPSEGARCHRGPAQHHGCDLAGDLEPEPPSGASLRFWMHKHGTKLDTFIVLNRDVWG